MRFRPSFTDRYSRTLLLVKILLVLLVVVAVIIWLWYNSRIEVLDHRLKH